MTKLRSINYRTFAETTQSAPGELLTLINPRGWHAAQYGPNETNTVQVGSAAAMRKLVLCWFALCAGSLLAVSSTAYAHEHELKWRLRTELAAFDPTGHITESAQGVTEVHRELETAGAIGLTIEYRHSYYFGLNIGLLRSRSFSANQSTSNEPAQIGNVTPLTAGLNFHLTPENPIDAYIGAFVAWVNYGDATFNNAGTNQRVRIGSDYGWGLIAGADIPLGRRGWTMHGSFRYLKTRLQSDAGPLQVQGDINPIIVSVGIGFRF